MSRSLRMFEIIQLLRQATRPMTAARIAEELEVTSRTVYRDVAALQARRVPVRGEAGIGYVLQQGFELPPLMFDAEELEAISTGLTLLARTNDAGLVGAAKRVTAKLRDVVPEQSQDILANSVIYASTVNRVPSSVVESESIRRSIVAGEKVEIAYKDSAGDESSRLILPLAMIFYLESTVVVAWCFLRDDFRHFRLDRIVSLTTTTDCLPDRAAELRRTWRDRIKEPWVNAAP